MSDPLSNREIEDVLSSIRRLVAQGDPARSVAAQPGAPPEKLVLTPAFRVAAAAEKPVAAEAVPEVTLPDNLPEQDAAAHLAPAAPPSLEATIAELEAAISAYGGPFEPDVGDAVTTTPTAPDLQFPVAPTAPDAETHDRLAGAKVADTTPPLPKELSSSAVEPAEKPTADRADPAPNVHSFHHVPGPQQAASAPNDDASLLDSEDDELPLPMDEALLRELVTDILREELQGALGQRITRNVRKLVRAEIARALASRDLA